MLFSTASSSCMPAHNHYSNLRLSHQTQLPLAYKYEAIVPPNHSSVIICYLLLFITMKLLTATLALFLLLTSSYLQTAMAGSAFCDSKCKVRCSKASVQDRCLKYCGVCCQACHCVPSGTYGNKDECPCYRDKVTNDKKRKPKCP